jgi:hypothetical protein
MAKVQRKPTPQTVPAVRVSKASPHLKKEELKRVDDLRVNIVGSKGKSPDVESTLELMYLRVLGQVGNRTASESELKALKKTLDLAATQITSILKKAGGSSKSK